MAFGPHGPRAPTSAPGDGVKLFFGTAGLVGLAGVLYFIIQQFGKSLKLFLKEKKDFLVCSSKFLSFFVSSL